MTDETYSTRDVPPGERLKYWHNKARDIFADRGFRCVETTPDGFDADLRHARCGDLDVFDLAAGAHTVRRTDQIGSEPAILVTLQREGRCEISQDGRADVLRSGDFTMLDSSRKFELRFRGFARQCVLRFPRAIFDRHLALPETLIGQRISGANGTGYMAAQMILSFLKEAHRLDETESARLSGAMIDVINVAALSRLNSKALNVSSYSALQLHRIRLHIEEQLRDSRLTPSRIARANGISNRTLNKLFEAEGITVNRYLRCRRLENCRRDLTDPLFAGFTVTEIAYSWGFNSSSHFSRAFKTEFGVSPRAIRSQATKLAAGQSLPKS